MEGDGSRTVTSTGSPDLRSLQNGFDTLQTLLYLFFLLFLLLTKRKNSSNIEIAERMIRARKASDNATTT